MVQDTNTSPRAIQSAVCFVLALFLAVHVSGQCTTPNPKPFGVLLRQDYSIEFCYVSEFRQQPPNLVQSVRQWLPERSSPLPALLSTSNNPNLVFTSPSTIYITFVDEGAGYRNALGYFVYDANNNVISRVAVFPDASSSPATVRTGDTVRVGPFATGTRVGFFLIGNGFNNRYWQTNLASSTYWTIDSLNHDKKRHFAMFTESLTGKVMIGIEDLYNLGDRDYNDAVFFVDVDGSINNNQFPTMLLVTTPKNTDVRITLQLEAGNARRIDILSLPSRGSIFQVNADGSKGAIVTAINTVVTNKDFLLIYTPAKDTYGAPYTTFSVNEILENGQVIFVTVRVDVLSYAPYAPVPISKTVSTNAGELTLIQLEATDAQNLNVLATVSSVTTNGILYQYNAGSPGAQITANSRLSDPANRLYYRSSIHCILSI